LRWSIRLKKWCYPTKKNDSNRQNTRWKNVGSTKHKMKMMMLSCDKTKMMLKNKQQK
jgi:hypothetical protein